MPIKSDWVNYIYAVLLCRTFSCIEFQVENAMWSFIRTQYVWISGMQIRDSTDEKLFVLIFSLPTSLPQPVQENEGIQRLLFITEKSISTDFKVSIWRTLLSLSKHLCLYHNCLCMHYWLSLDSGYICKTMYGKSIHAFAVKAFLSFNNWWMFITGKFIFSVYM